MSDPADEQQPPPDEPEVEAPPEPDEQAEPEPEGPAFDTEAFVRALPEGVCLCPLCLGMGAIVEQPPMDPNSHLCGECLGWGKLRLPSLVGGQTERPCGSCGGAGWVLNYDGEPPAVPARPEHFAAEQPPLDYHGRTPDDPEFDWSRVVARPAAGEPLPAAEPALG